MFGQHDQPQDNTIPDHSIEGAMQGDTPHNDQPRPSGDAPQKKDNSWQHPGAPIGGEKTIAPTPHPHPNPPPITIPSADDHDDHQTSDENTAVANDLIDIKQQALQKLTPLVGHLEQSPEERFRTTMMMIQASDDQNLIKTAYEAAGQIENEKARAQALLDIVNEINYFTQNQI